MNNAQATCAVCGEPMAEGEEMFKFHGYYGPRPKPPLPKVRAAEPSRGTPDFLRRIEQAEQESGLTQSQENLLHDLHQYFAGGHVVLLEALKKRQVKGHNDTCAHMLIAEYDCDCGYVEAEAAIKQAERTGEKK